MAFQVSGPTTVSVNGTLSVDRRAGSADRTGFEQAVNQSAESRRVEAQRQLVEQSQVRELAARDREVRAHEQAHAATGGIYASAPVYEFTRGPNGVRYATSGHVNIDVSEVPGDPAATLEKLTQVSRAALAPAQPSPQDRAVAAQAQAGAAQARAELAAVRSEETAELTRGDDEEDEVGSRAAAADNNGEANDGEANSGALPVSAAGRIASATGPSAADAIGTLLNLFA